MFYSMTVNLHVPRQYKCSSSKTNLRIHRSMGIVHLTLILFAGCQIQGIENISKSYFNTYTWLNFAMTKVVASLSPMNRVMVFTSKQFKLAPQRDIIRYISSKKPVIITDAGMLHKIPHKIRNSLFNSNISIYVILLYYEYDAELKSILQTLTKQAPTITRPKCLVIYFHSHKGKMSFTKVCERAWKEKFLDFTIIDVNVNLPRSVPTIGYYNPFESHYYNKNLHETEAIFPDKLVNTHHYEFIVKTQRKKLPSRRWPDIEYDDQRWLLIEALNKLNFTLKHGGSKNDQANMGFTSRISSKPISVPKLRIYSDCEKLIAVVPVIPILRLGNYYLAIGSFGISVAFLVTVSTLRLLSGDKGSFWNTFNLTRILIGMSADILPRTRVQSIVFIFFAFISMKYSADFYDEILGIRLIHGARAFDTFADIDNSELRIYIDQNKSKVALLNMTDPFAARITEKFIFGNSSLNCLKNLKMKQQIICVMEESMAIKNFNVSVMRIAKPVFACLYWEYGLEAGSPYIKRLQRLTNLLLEAGMNQYLQRNKKLSVGAAMLSSENDEFITLVIFGFVLGVGYGMSIIAFFCECGYGRWKMKRAATRFRRFFLYLANL